MHILDHILTGVCTAFRRKFLSKLSEKGADLVLAFDEGTPFHVNPEYTARLTDRSPRWEMRSLKEIKF